MKVVVMKDQSLFDVVLQVLGDVSGVITLAKLNNTSITAELVAGQVLEIPGPAINPVVTSYYDGKKLTPVTGNLNTLVSDRVFSREFTKEFS